jgi:hypothetical protein
MRTLAISLALLHSPDKLHVFLATGPVWTRSASAANRWCTARKMSVCAVVRAPFTYWKRQSGQVGRRRICGVCRSVQQFVDSYREKHLADLNGW